MARSCQLPPLYEPLISTFATRSANQVEVYLNFIFYVDLKFLWLILPCFPIWVLCLWSAIFLYFQLLPLSVENSSKIGVRKITPICDYFYQAYIKLRLYNFREIRGRMFPPSLCRLALWRRNILRFIVFEQLQLAGQSPYVVYIILVTLYWIVYDLNLRLQP